MSGAFRVYQDTGNPRDIHFELLGASVPTPQSQLRDDIEATLIVLRGIFADGDHRFGEYYRQILSLAQAGLVGDAANPEISGRALKGIQQDIVAREAGRIKNQYMRKLGCWALGAIAGLLLTIAALTRFGGPTTVFVVHMLTVQVGCVAGVWLSFGTRKTNLRFEDLNVLEEDRLDPIIRIVFTGLLTLIIALAFHLKALSITLGSVSTDQIATNPVLALFVGLLCGVGEKGLSSKVTQQASALLR